MRKLIKYQSMKANWQAGGISQGHEVLGGTRARDQRATSLSTNWQKCSKPYRTAERVERNVTIININRGVTEPLQINADRLKGIYKTHEDVIQNKMAMVFKQHGATWDGIPTWELCWMRFENLTPPHQLLLHPKRRCVTWCLLSNLPVIPKANWRMRSDNPCN
jgi:hypothetical protein